MKALLMTKFIFVTGGVISSVGKGVITASLGKLLKDHGIKTTLIKVDPYINYDAGTLRPTEHGEVWVTDDGGEIDQDLGTYERFLNTDIPKQNCLTTGQIYKSVIDKERSGHYLGKTVQFLPHIPDKIIERIKNAAQNSDADVAIIEIGGTIGDYENIPYLFAAKTLERDLGPENVAHVLVTYLPVPKHIKEMKTKPTQQAIKLLREEGIFPDFIICRSEKCTDEVRKKKINTSVHIKLEHIISAPDLETVYEVPLHLQKEKLPEKIIQRLNLQPKKELQLFNWKTLVNNIKKPSKQVNIAIVGKYLALGDYDIQDSYLSIYESLIHCGAELATKINITWLSAQDFEDNKEKLQTLKTLDGIIVPGGFGTSGVEGKINVINYARVNKIPYLGLCYGMQLACVEFARNVCNMTGAHTTEVNPQTKYPIIDVLPDQKNILNEKNYGGTMRLGGYHAELQKNTRTLDLYKKTNRLEQDQQLLKNKNVSATTVIERHRHRYEVNPAFVQQLENKGLIFSGKHQRSDGTTLMEFIEIKDHPFFIATQAHPEFKSRLSNPSPLFYGFTKACLELQNSTTQKKTTIKQKAAMAQL